MVGIIKVVFVMAVVLGSLLVIIFITRLLNWIIYKLIFRKKISRNIAVICSSLICLIILYVIRNPKMTQVMNNFDLVFIYIPCIICVLFYDIFLSPASEGPKLKRKGRTL
jgi:hypothetical protein